MTHEYRCCILFHIHNYYHLKSLSITMDRSRKNLIIFYLIIIKKNTLSYAWEADPVRRVPLHLASIRRYLLDLGRGAFWLLQQTPWGDGLGPLCISLGRSVQSRHPLLSLSADRRIAVPHLVWRW